MTVLDVPMIQTRGFRNRDGGGGFELRLRLPYYRGVWTNLVEGASVTVDGEHFGADDIAWSIGDDQYTLAELTSSTDARWSVDVPATLHVPRAEPLAIGLHDVDVELRVRMSYIPEELQPTIWSEERRLVITR
ncbi:MAG TPA: DUF6379 domain-containing protein [Lapillicoccus sp.]|nr:DUF6379 domain-containing protein [Lapillicoccus sp.]